MRYSFGFRVVEGDVFGYDERPGFARFPKSEVAAPFGAKLAVVSKSVNQVVDLTNLKCAFPVVQILPDRRILVASSRCHRWQDGSVEMNAKVYGNDGQLHAEFCFGDGLKHVQADTLGRIWAGYTDEGVYGNYGWGFTPVGSMGLVCFDENGNRIWEYTAPSGHPPISDCYVLNVVEDVVWACYYTDFPIVRIDSAFQVQAWQSDLSGPRQMAVADDTLLA